MRKRPSTKVETRLVDLGSLLARRPVHRCLHLSLVWAITSEVCVCVVNCLSKELIVCYYIAFFCSNGLFRPRSSSLATSRNRDCTIDCLPRIESALCLLHALTIRTFKSWLRFIENYHLLGALQFLRKLEELRSMYTRFSTRAWEVPDCHAS